MSPPAGDSRLVAAAETAIHRGDFAFARRLLRTAPPEDADRARALLASLEPDRAAVIAGAISLLIFAAVFCYYVLR